MATDDVKGAVVRRVQAAFAAGEILDANKIAEEIKQARPTSLSLAAIAEMVLAESSHYGGAAAKVGE